jgi:hypothetical protein
MVSMRPQGLPEIPELTAAVAAAAFPDGSLAMRVRDELAGVFADEPFGARGPAGLSPGMLALVTVLQFPENLTDRPSGAGTAAAAARSRHRRQGLQLGAIRTWLRRRNIPHIRTTGPDRSASGESHRSITTRYAP